ncbi:tubulin polyglutamylase TTLL5 isoform X1 [Danaus plexippus]|uniref:tubulin polyglutamylase TTLL5 isoform X1 n=2 Tax=Danaus plexippus TaxID=13037 RepID=UPI002AB32281|nr:tubulin polyglutamylase TTLL5 isoform X1 [Danaus plexippus]XP_061384347.1 tubulin polyglutamylase TTLL5 isoform X1 [Danaus plexippus]
MDQEDEFKPQFKIDPDDLPKIHKKCNHNRPHTSPHASPEKTNPSTSGLQTLERDSMRRHDDETHNGKEKENEGSISDWVSGGPIGSKGAVLVFRSCVLATRTPSVESTTKTVGNNTGTTILLNKAKNMARRLVAEPHAFSVRPKNIMHDVMETFGNSNKYTGQAFVVRHVSEAEVPETMSVDDQGHERTEHKRDIDDVLNDLNKITLKKNLNIENTTANIKPPDDPMTVNKDKEDKKGKKSKGKNKRKNTHNQRPVSPALDSDDSEHMLVKEVDSVKVLDSNNMPARMLKITYRLVNTETKLLHRLLQAHGLQEASSEAKDFNLMWAGLHPKPDVLRSLTPYQRVNHFPRVNLVKKLLDGHGLLEAHPESATWTLFWSTNLTPFEVLRSLTTMQKVNHLPRSYELTRKDKLFKNIEKMQYFRGLKHFDFIPTTFLMPNEYKELCTTHYRTKGPWIVKPAASSRGRGIYIVNTPEQIPKGENVVVAKYIDKPLLIGGHKCDLRLYVCVTSIDPLLIYLYEEGLVRFATVKYDKTNKNLWNPCMHLCNYSINKYHTDYIKCDDPNAGNIGHKWTLSALLRHLRKQGRNTSALMAAIEDLVVKSILSSAQTITAAARVFVPSLFNCFELFGYDILVDDMLKPWLLEINLSPSLACESPLDARVKSALLADTLTLVGLPAVPGNRQEQLGPQATSLKMRIGACRRVHSAENACVRNKSGGPGAGAGSGVPGAGPLGNLLTGEELRIVRAVRAQYARRGGFVRIFPSQNSWQKYSQYLDPVTGIPVCSTSLNNNTPYTVIHNYNLLVHSHVLPHFQHATVATSLTDTPERLKRYEAACIAGAAPAVQLSEPATPAPRDARRAKDLVKRQLAEGMTLTRGEVRRAFGMYLTHVLKRISSPCTEQGAQHAALVLRFLRRASASLRMPYNVKGPPAKMCDKDRCAVIAKQLNDFLYMYYRETDLYTDSEDKAGCVSNIHFAQFLYSAR